MVIYAQVATVFDSGVELSEDLEQTHKDSALLTSSWKAISQVRRMSPTKT
jgi:hypothetical protein